MDFGLSAEPAAQQAAGVAFARSLNDGLLTRDREGAFPGARWQRCADFSEAAVESALDAMPSHGGSATEVGVERELRDAAGGRSGSGPSEIQTMRLAGLLGR